MSAYVIFDPKNNLIFSKCDEPFRKSLFQTLEIKDFNNPDYYNNEPSTSSDELLNKENDTHQEMVHNWLSIYLTPYVSTFRELPSEGRLEFDLMPLTSVFHKKYHEFIFMNLICQDEQSNNEREVDQHVHRQSVILHQFKINVFCQSATFLCGNALYLLARNESIQYTLFAMIDQWYKNSSQISFMIESIEKLYIGFHITKICEELAFKLERILKLEMKTFNNNKEIFSFCFILYKNKMVYKLESNNRIRLKPRDLTLLLLLSQLPDQGEEEAIIPNNINENSIGNHLDQLEQSSQCNKRNKGKLKTSQKLVFLQSSSLIPVPHAFRKISITKDLYIICISEISSILMISLPTLIHSVIDHKTNLISNMKNDSKSSIDYLIKCIRSLDKYIQKNLETFHQRHLFNLSSLDNLNELARKAHSGQTNLTSHLVQEQTSRIFTILMDSLHQSYEKVFKTLCDETTEYHFKPFQRIAQNILKMDTIGKLNNCLDFINLKYQRNVTLLNNLQALQVYSNLLGFILVNRNENYFLEDHRDELEDQIGTLYQNLIFKAYRQVMQLNQNIIFWNDEQFFYIYFCWAESLMFLKEMFDKLGTLKVEMFNLNENGSISNMNVPRGTTERQRMMAWPNLFIDEWFKRKNVSNEFFAIIDSTNTSIDSQLKHDISNNIFGGGDSSKSWIINYLTNIVQKINWHIDSSLSSNW